jgi:hypothetical protein
MDFPIVHNFRVDGIYVCKIDPDSTWGYTKQSDGSHKPHKQGMFSKLFEVATTKKLSTPYKVIVVRERINYDLDGRVILSWSDAHLEVSQLTVTGELYSIINGFKDKNKYSKPWAFIIEPMEQAGGNTIWKSVDKESSCKLNLKNGGNMVVYSSVDLQGRPYTDEYHFMQWELR